EAEEMYLRALRGKEAAWGPKHTSTLDTVNNLGLLYSNQGKMQEAEEMYLRALAGYQEAEGNHGRRVEDLRVQLSALDANSRSSSASMTLAGHTTTHREARAQSQSNRSLIGVLTQENSEGSIRRRRKRDLILRLLGRR
ncbi:hypothetical protein LTR22_027626, partial [Elasticomyces elasticus]